MWVETDQNQAGPSPAIFLVSWVNSLNWGLSAHKAYNVSSTWNWRTWSPLHRLWRKSLWIPSHSEKKQTQMCYCKNDRHKRRWKAPNVRFLSLNSTAELVRLTSSFYHMTRVLTNVWLFKRPADHYFSNIKFKHEIWHLYGIWYHKD